SPVLMERSRNSQFTPVLEPLPLGPYSAASCCGLVEAGISTLLGKPTRIYSAPSCCGLIEAPVGTTGLYRQTSYIPQHLAAASLKPLWPVISQGNRYSAASCCGFIEAIGPELRAEND